MVESGAIILFLISEMDLSTSISANIIFDLTREPARNLMSARRF
ncbi:MAG: hypothetical protein QMC87_04975 [Methanothermobacter thermautotrophicus]|nr:hypothetical protein [Methanothermobacter thermautotrophicus]